MASITSKTRCLITAGPTREYLDPVRYLTNGSSGKMGYALAEVAFARGWHVDLVSGPVAQRASEGIAVTRVVSAQDMYEATDRLFDTCTLFIAVAAVADYRPRDYSPVKQKKADGDVGLTLVRTIDILKTLSARRQPGQVVVGFAAETTDVEAYAQKKLVEKRLDWIVANQVDRYGTGMESDLNSIIMLGSRGERIPFGPAPKSTVAEFILHQLGVG